MNLKRIRESRNLSQEKLAEMINTKKPRISALENGKEGMGKAIMERLCRTFNIRPYEFYLEPDTPIIEDEKEKELLYTFREAKALGDVVAENIPKYGRFIIQETKKPKEKGVRKGRKVRTESIG